QRVAIARALAGRPSVVVADGPSGALDQTTGRSVLQIRVDSCRDSGASLVMVTHDGSVAAACRRTVAMQDGRIAHEFVRPDAATVADAATAATAAGVNGTTGANSEVRRWRLCSPPPRCCCAVAAPSPMCSR